MIITGKIPREVIGISQNLRISIMDFERALKEIQRTKPRFKLYPPLPALDIFRDEPFITKRLTEQISYPIYVITSKEDPVIKIEKP